MSSNKRISVLLTPDVFRRFNAYCSQQGFKKSTLIARLIREHMQGQDGRGSREQDAKSSRPSR